MKTSSAPGKLVLAGEYAVLDGHAAWVTAVDRRAVVKHDLVPASSTSLRVSSHSRAEQSLDDDVDDGFFDLVRAVVQQSSLSVSGVLHVDTRDMEREEKLGVGSSAAVAAAIAHALLSTTTATPKVDDVHALAHAAHLAFSSGKGSGIDVAAACYGGCVAFKKGPPIVVQAAPLDVTGVDVLVVFTGHSQSTRAFVQKVQEHQQAHPEAHDDVVAQLSAAAQKAMACKKPEELFAAIDDAAGAMNRLGDVAGIDIVSQPHQNIIDIAHRHGGAAKPSGAGGGDVALAFVPSDVVGRARAELTSAGFDVIDVELGAPGVGRP